MPFAAVELAFDHVWIVVTRAAPERRPGAGRLKVVPRFRLRTPMRNRRAFVKLEGATAQASPRCSTQRSGVAPPHPEGDLWSGAASNGRLDGVACLAIAFPDGVPLTRAMNPWAMPAAST